MAALQIILTLVVLLLAVLAISKKFNTTTALLCIGVVTLIIYSIVTGTSLMDADTTSGNSFVDVFEFSSGKFATNIAGSGLLIMSVMGFVKYMDTINASKLLALYASKPLKKLGKPYLVMALGMIIAAILKLCIPSHSGLTTLLMATLYPIFIASGATSISAAAAVVIGGAFDMGPACPITNWAVAQEPVAKLTTVANFFAKYQLPRESVMLLVAIIVFIIVGKAADKKTVQSTKTVDEITIESLHTPALYALFPLIPLILVVIFSDLFATGIKMSVVAANIIGFLIAFVVDMIVKKDKKQTFNETQKFWDGMGVSFAKVVALICTASIFSTALTKIGGTDIIMNSVGTSNAGGAVVVIVAAVVNFLMATVTGSGVASSYAVLPMLYGAVEASGSNLLIVVFAIVASGGLGRALSPVSGAVIIASGASGHDVLEIVKRTAIPTIAAFVVLLILAVAGL